MESKLDEYMEMNESLRGLFERKSVRVFEKREISPEVRELILRAATQAPSAGNMQLYAIVEVTDPAKKARFAETCDHQPFIATAPMVLAFCADCRRWYKTYAEAGCEPRKPGAGDLLLAVTDAVIAAQNAVTAAWSLGVGSCYIGDITEHRAEHKALLGLPDYVFPAAMVVFGYPTRQQRERVKPERFRMEDIVFEDAYRDRSGAELREMLAPRCGEQGYDAWVRKAHDRKYASDFSLEMTRSVEEYLGEYGMERRK